MKKITKYYLLGLIIYFCPLTFFGQQEFGLKLNGGVSYLNVTYPSSNFNLTTTNNYVQPYGELGIFYNSDMKRDISFGTELLCSYFSGKERIKMVEITPSGTSSGAISTDNVWRHVYYLELPVYVGFNIKNLNVNFGVQLNCPILSGAEEKGQATDNGNLVTWNNKFNHLAIDPYDYGIRAGVMYALTDRVSINANCYYGLNNIIADKNLEKYWSWRVEYASLGLKWKLSSFGKKK